MMHSGHPILEKRFDPLEEVHDSESSIAIGGSRASRSGDGAISSLHVYYPENLT